MKKISLLASFVMAAFAMQAQIPGLGLKGGLNLASWSNNGSSVNYQNRVGFNAGLFANINVSPNFAVQPEVVYSSQGTKYNPGNQVPIMTTEAAFKGDANGDGKLSESEMQAGHAGMKSDGPD